MKVPPPVVLLVEDNDDDVFIFTRLCRKIGFEHPLQVVRDGEEAIDYFSGKGAFSDRALYPMPDMVMLDLKLPLQPGLDVLAWMRDQPALSGIPVIVLTSSAELRDIARARKLKASAYLVKPPRREVLRKLFDELQKPVAESPNFDVEGNRLSNPGQQMA